MDKLTNEPALMAETVLQTLRAQPNLFAQFPIKPLALFGSVARDEATEASDRNSQIEW